MSTNLGTIPAFKPIPSQYRGLLHEIAVQIELTRFNNGKFGVCLQVTLLDDSIPQKFVILNPDSLSVIYSSFHAMDVHHRNPELRIPFESCYVILREEDLKLFLIIIEREFKL